MENNTSLQYIKPLDGLRGIAISLVLMFHCLNFTHYPLKYLSDFGWTGVDLFFVLSGFLITRNLLATKGNQKYFYNFFRNRILRIFPLYYLVLLSTFLICNVFNIVLNQVSIPKTLNPDFWYFFTYTQNLIFAFKGWQATEMLHHLWSLAIEEQFYLFWPFVVYYLNEKKIVYVTIILIVLAIVIRNIAPIHHFSYTFTFARTDALALGAIAAIFVKNRNIHNYLNQLQILFVCLALVLLTISIITKNTLDQNEYFIRIGYTLIAIVYTCLLLFVFAKTKFALLYNKFLSNQYLCFLGKYAYGIYIYHWLFYKTIYLYLESNYILPWYSIWLFVFCIILLSYVSYHLFEVQFLKYKIKTYKEAETNLK